MKPEGHDREVMFDRAPAYLALHAPDGSVELFNDSAREFLGIDTAGLRLEEWTALCHRDDRDRVRENVRLAFEVRRPFEFEARVRRHDGEYGWLLVRGRPVEAGTDGRWVSSAVEIDELVHARGALRERVREVAEAHAALDAFQEAAPVGFALVDRDYRYLRANRRLADMNGVPLEETLGRTIAEVVPRIWPTVEPLYRRVLETGQAITNLELSGETKAAPGVTRDWLLNYFAVRVGGELFGIGAVILDVTENTRLKREAAQALALLETMLDATPIALAFVDHELVIVRDNRAMADFTGRPGERHAGRRVEEVAPEAYPVVGPLMRRVLDTGEPVLDLELAGESSGEQRLWQVGIYPVEVEGRRVGVGWVGVDVTEPRRLAADRRRLLAELMGAQESERRTIAEELHDDVIQRLSAIRLRLEMLESELEDPRRRDDAARIRDELAAAVATVRDVASSIRPTGLATKRLAAAIRSCLRSEDPDLAWELQSDLAEEPPDPARLVLYRNAAEAIANVRKHARASRVDVELGQRDGGYLLRVRDDGIGGDLSPSPGHLGLSMMRERAELAGGWLRAEARPDEGTTIECWIPARTRERAILGS